MARSWRSKALFRLVLASHSAPWSQHFHSAQVNPCSLISDGVIEARNAQGELFGFERAASLSTQSADQIANAAKQFGQEDDITVLTLARA